MKRILFFFIFPVLTFGQLSVDHIQELFQLEQYKKAETTLTTYLNNHPKEIKALELLGETYAYQENWNAAMKIFKSLVKIDESNANYHYQYGGAMGMKAVRANKLTALFMVSDIKKEFIKATELDKNHIDARWALVVLYTQLPSILGGSQKKALNYAEELKSISPVDGYLSTGYVYEDDEDSKLAEKYYKKAIEVGGSITCYQKLTDLYEKNGQAQKAIDNIEKTQQMHQRNSLNYQLGKVSAAYNIDLEKGKNCLFKYIKNHSPNDGIPLEWAYYRLAQIYKHENNKVTALKWINISLNTLPDFEEALAEKKLILKM
jgi:tetratricopeptide (TPR) repeat protein